MTKRQSTPGLSMKRAYMSSTVTSTLGYGIRIDPKIFTDTTGMNQERYSDAYLDEQKYPMLHIAYEGIASLSIHDKPNHWIFIKPGLARIYSGISGDGMTAPVSVPDLNDNDVQEAKAQLEQWCREYGHDGINAQWRMVLWIN